MLISVIAAIFKYKLASTIFVLSCWSSNERVKFMHQLMVHGIRATVSCDANGIPQPSNHQLHGVLYFSVSNITKEVSRRHFGYWYKWVIVGDHLPPFLNSTRYDADVVLVTSTRDIDEAISDNSIFPVTSYNIHDVYVHPAEEPSIHPWAYWSPKYGLQIKYDRERLLRRWNLKKYTLKIATPMGTYSNETYNGSFIEYLMDMSISEKDAGVRAGYMTASLIVEALNATEEMIPTILWSTETNNSSMVLKLRIGTADISGAIFRILPERVERLDFPVSLWPFQILVTITWPRLPIK